MRRWLLLLIVLLGFVIRVWNLQSYPPGFNQDEAAFGYNAYSLLKTGLDEWSVPWYRLPFTNLRSFGDYKPPLYAFLAVPTVRLFGLNEFATRLPAALVGTLSLLAVYLLAFRLTRRWEIAIWAAFILALLPWHVSLSRGAFEANLASLFLPLGLYAFLSRRFRTSALVFALGFYTYHSLRYLTPLFALSLVCYFRPRISKSVINYLVILAVLCLPGIWSMFGSGTTRAMDIAIFSPTDNWQAVADRRFTGRINGLPDSLARLFSNKPVYVLSQFTSNYLNYLSPQFLFTSGAGEANYGVIPGRGLFYLIELPLLLGFVYLLVKKTSPGLKLLGSWLLLSPVPAALTKGSGYAANRAAVMIPFLVIACAVVAGRLNRKAGIILLVLLFGSFTYFAQEYIYQSSRELAPSMLAGRREAFTRMLAISPLFKQVQISRSISEPQIFLAFYGQISPVEYQQASGSWAVYAEKGYHFLDQYDGYTLGKYRFGDIHPEKNTGPVLYLGLWTDFPENYPEFFHIDYPDGRHNLKVAGNLAL